MTQPEAQATYERRRRRARPWRKWYSTKAWKLRREEQLSRVPWCEPCRVQGHTVRATVANHRTPHRGDRRLFFHGPLESTCKTCHDGAIQLAETHGFRRDIGEDGWPVDPAHPFNAVRIS